MSFLFVLYLIYALGVLVTAGFFQLLRRMDPVPVGWKLDLRVGFFCGVAALIWPLFWTIAFFDWLLGWTNHDESQRSQ